MGIDLCIATDAGTSVALFILCTFIYILTHDKKDLNTSYKAVDEIMKLVSSALSSTTYERVITYPSVMWRKAFELNGTGTAKRRSSAIETILQQGTSIESQPSLLEKDLLLEVLEIAENAIKSMDGRLVYVDDKKERGYTRPPSRHFFLAILSDAPQFLWSM